MNQNDYIIVYDENGTPYIAHGVLSTARNAVSNAGNRLKDAWDNHKYILRIKNDDGTFRYFYTQDEVRAYYDEMKKAAQGVVDKAKTTVKNTTQAISDKTGIGGRKRVEEAQKNLNDANRGYKQTERVVKENQAADKGRPGNIPSQRTVDSARALGEASAKRAVADRQLREAQDSYRNSLLGRGESAFNNAKASANNVVSNAKNRFERMKGEFRDKAEDAAQTVVDATINKPVEAARKIASNAKETATDIMANAKRTIGVDARKDRDKAQQDYVQAERDAAKSEQVAKETRKKGEPDSQGQLWFKTEKDARQNGDAELGAIRARNEAEYAKKTAQYMQDRYDETALGKTEKAKDAVSDTMAAGRKKIEEIAGPIREKASDVASSVKDKAERVTQVVQDSLKGIADGIKITGNKIMSKNGNKEFVIPEKYLKDGYIPESYIQNVILPEVSTWDNADIKKFK